MSKRIPIPLEVLSEVITVGQVTYGIAPENFIGFPVLVIYVNDINLIYLSSLDWRWTFSQRNICCLKQLEPENATYLDIFLKVCSESKNVFEKCREYSITRCGTNIHEVMQEFSTAIDELYGDTLK